MRRTTGPFGTVMIASLLVYGGCSDQLADDSVEQNIASEDSSEIRGIAPTRTTQFAYEADSLFLVQDGRMVSGTYTSPTSNIGIHFEVVRGSAVPSHDSHAPPYELSVRFFDRNGDTFILVGQEPLWDREMSIPSALVAPSQRLEDFTLAGEAAIAINEVHFPEHLTWEKQALIDAGAFLVLEMTSGRSILPSGEIQLEASNTTGHRIHDVVASDPSAAETPWTHQVLIRKKAAGENVLVNGQNINITEHSAILLLNYYQNSAYMYKASSNHGTAANSGLMSTKCSAAWANRANMWPPFRDNACSTPYGIHVCNNDTFLEYAMAHDNSDIGGFNWRCYGLMALAPSCY